MINTKLLLKEDKAEDKMKLKQKRKNNFSTSIIISMPLFFF
jgi:hypothetical protein